MSPTITAAKAKLFVDETNSKDLTCTGTARPAPTLTWSKGSTPIVAGGRYKITEGQPQLSSTTGLTSVLSTLQISNTGDSDRGQYTCTATSPKTVVPKFATTNVELVVNGKSGIIVMVTWAWSTLLSSIVLTLCEATAKSTNLRNTISYKSVLYQKKRSTFAYYNLTLSKRVCLADHEKQIQKFVAHWKVCQNSSQREVISENAYKAPKTAKCVAPCVASQIFHVSDKLPSFPSKTEFLSRKRDFQTTLSSRSQLKLNAGKPFTSSWASQTWRQELRTTPIHWGARGWREPQLQRAKTTTFSWVWRSFQSVNRIAWLSAACTQKMATLW